MKLAMLTEWDAAEDLAAALTVWGCAAIPRFFRDASPLSVMPNCCNVLDKAI